MIDKLKQVLFGDKRAWPEEGPDVQARDAAAALLVEAAATDGSIDKEELVYIEAFLRDRFDLSVEKADRLLLAATNAADKTVQLYGLAKTIKDTLDYDDRLALIETLWEVAYADGKLHDYETNLIRRVCGLIYVSDQDSGRMRKKVRDRMGLSDD